MPARRRKLEKEWDEGRDEVSLGFGRDETSKKIGEHVACRTRGRGRDQLCWMMAVEPKRQPSDRLLASPSLSCNVFLDSLNKRGPSS
jgi:hypothetical protein